MDLTPEELASPVPGTYGSILDTLRHLVGADAWYLQAVTAGRRQAVEEDDMDLRELRREMETNAGAWSELLADDLDPTVEIEVVRSDGSRSYAPLGIRLAQAVHHGTDHRSQICTALTLLGHEPPGIDVWDFGWLDDRVYELDAEGATGDR